MSTTTVKKGFIQDFGGNRLLPITRAELVLDAGGYQAFRSEAFAATTSMYGLMSPSDKETLATLSTSTTADIDNKLKAINEGLIFGEQPLRFYGTNSETNAVEPIPWTINANEGIEIGVANNIITFKTKLDNIHLPGTISGKKLDGVIVVSIPDDGVADRASYVANVGYVDEKFGSAMGAAAGGLRFKGTLSWLKITKDGDEFVRDNELTNILQNTNGFYIWAESDVLVINGKHMQNDLDTTVGHGDILIVAEGTSISNKFVHVPSGNEITGLNLISQTDEGDDTITIAQGMANLVFDKIFSVARDAYDSDRITISLPKADGNHDGYLSSQDYLAFSQASSKSLTITPTEGVRRDYEIATINPGKDEQGNDQESATLYGKDTTYQMTSDTDGIKFNYANPSSENPLFTIEPGVGIAFNTDIDNQVRIDNNLQVLKAPEGTLQEDINDSNDSTDYLHIEGGSIQAKIGSVENFNNPVNGLASVELVHYMLTNFTTHWITIDHDLTKPEKNPAKDNLYYGTGELQEAIQFKNTNE